MSQFLGGSVDTTSTTSASTGTHQPNDNLNDENNHVSRSMGIATASSEAGDNISALDAAKTLTNASSTNITPSDDLASRKRQQSFISSTSVEDERQVGQKGVASNIPNQMMMSRFLETTPDSSPTHSGLGNDEDIHNQGTAPLTNITPTEQLSARKRQRMTTACTSTTVVHQPLQQHQVAYTPPSEDFCELLNLVDKLREENDLLTIKCSTYEAENKTLKEQNAHHVQTRR